MSKDVYNKLYSINRSARVELTKLESDLINHIIGLGDIHQQDCFKLQDCDNKLNELQGRNKDLLQMMNTLKEKAAHDNENIARMEETIATHTLEIQKLNQRLLEAEQISSNAEAEKIQIENELEGCRNDIIDGKTKLLDKGQTIQKLSCELKELKKLIHAKNENLQRKQSEIQDYKIKNQNMKNQNIEKDQLIDSLFHKNDMLTFALKEEREKLEIKQNELQKYEQKEAIYTESIEHYRNEILEIEKINKELLGEIEAAKVEIEKLKAELAETKVHVKQSKRSKSTAKVPKSSKLKPKEEQKAWK